MVESVQLLKGSHFAICLQNDNAMISKNKLIPLKRLPNFYNISARISIRNFELGKKVGPQASCPQPVCLKTRIENNY